MVFLFFECIRERIYCPSNTNSRCIMKNKNDYCGYSPAGCSSWAEEQKQLHSLFAPLASFAGEWFQAEERRLSDNERIKICTGHIAFLLGAPGKRGVLQNIMNSSMDGILDRLKQEYPKMRAMELYIFSLSASGFSIPLIRYLTGLRDEHAVSVVKNRLRRRLFISTSKSKWEYLSLVPRESRRMGKEISSCLLPPK